MTYETEQKNLIIRFLEEHAASQFSIQDLVGRFRAEHAIGKSTIYRVMKELTDKGLVRRFSFNNSKTFYYQYTNPEKCTHHLHMKCIVCGKLIHLNSMVSDFMVRQIQANHQFVLDESETVLYGTCQTCKGDC